MTSQTNRRDFLALLSMLPAAGVVQSALAQPQAQAMPERPIPSSGEGLPVVGLGSSKVVDEIAKNGEEPLRQVLRTLVARGGRLVDTWPRNPANDGRFGRVINEPELRDRLFVTSKIDRTGREAGIAQFQQAQELYGRTVIDLVQIFSLTDLDTHWPTLRGWKDAGAARYIGVTVSDRRLYERLEAFLQRQRPDFVQLNYSITERDAEERMLPLAADRGVAVLINRPFMNGTYFARVQDRPLPAWAAEFECTTWAQFSLKYILAHPAVTSVLTETSNPKHMDENALTARGPFPDERARQRMREFIQTV